MSQHCFLSFPSLLFLILTCNKMVKNNPHENVLFYKIAEKHHRFQCLGFCHQKIPRDDLLLELSIPLSHP